LQERVSAVDELIIGFKPHYAEGVMEILEDALDPRPSGRVVVPDLVDLMVGEASLLACRAGLTVETVVVTPNPAPVEGRVVRQAPAPGKKVGRGRRVTLYLESPEAPAAAR
jgi:hypothetical protein